jgi:hypothetical protein
MEGARGLLAWAWEALVWLDCSADAGLATVSDFWVEHVTWVLEWTGLSERVLFMVRHKW